MPENDKKFPSFREFVDSLEATQLQAVTAHPMAKVENEGAFSEMKQHLLSMYRGVEATHSFMDDAGQIFDCIPKEQQPSLRAAGTNVAKAPDLPAPPGTKSAEHKTVESQLAAGHKDAQGNVKRCPEGTIPVRRITMEELARFKDLQHFFQKTPVGKGRHPRLTAPETGSGQHKYAHAYQNVNNLGGRSFLNLWQPNVGSEVFSLSQQWFAGGSPVQTMECGWQVFPQKYNTTRPVLFIYWTADGYQHTGNYNLDASAFVQTNSNWTIGGAFTNMSADGGDQYECEICWYFYQGNWWLYLGGVTANDAIGYYPATLYGRGQLSQNATSADFGGETVNQVSWPPMGSGAFSNAGYKHAAYHRDICYFGTDGSLQRASLTPQQPSPSCYTIDVENTTDPWNVYFFFGGPGGSNCA
jgi:hypothetical protein